jgi:hypothetical protein
MKIKIKRKQKLKIAKNQKMALQPKYCANSPPIVGPNAGPKRIPAVAYPLYFPR